MVRLLAMGIRAAWGLPESILKRNAIAWQLSGDNCFRLQIVKTIYWYVKKAFPYKVEATIEPDS
jgi:hypothetical protein